MLSEFNAVCVIYAISLQHVRQKSIVIVRESQLSTGLTRADIKYGQLFADDNNKCQTAIQSLGIRAVPLALLKQK